MSPTPQVPEHVLELAAAREKARAAKDFAAADQARERIAKLGWTVVDEPGGSWRLEPRAPPEQVRLRAQEVPSVLQEPGAFDLTLQWVVEGWPQDIDRSIS